MPDHAAPWRAFGDWVHLKVSQILHIPVAHTALWRFRRVRESRATESCECIQFFLVKRVAHIMPTWRPLGNDYPELRANWALSIPIRTRFLIRHTCTCSLHTHAYSVRI